MALKVGLISDTHTNDGKAVRDAVRPYFEGVDLILHAGDIVTPEVLQALAELAPVEAVHGNMDPISMHLTLPARRVIALGRFTVGLIHGWGAPTGIEQRVLQAFPGEKLDALVFGHTHTPLVQHVGPVLLINPGSPTDRRWAPRNTVGILQVGETLSARIIDLPR